MKTPRSVKLRVLGVMTGTSCDGLDAACVEFGAEAWRPLWSQSIPYPAALKARVLEFQRPETVHLAREILYLERDLGNWYGKSLKRIIQGHLKQGVPDLIANHGQTVAHFPRKAGQGMTWQMGDGSRIALETGISVVGHFREGDIAAGGQGAPLLPAFHRLIAESIDLGAAIRKGVSIHNLGGISNLTYLGPKGKCLAFDTGPANLWIDGACALSTQGKMSYDRGGMLASRSTPNTAAVKALLRHPYFAKTAPKSTGRDEFPFEFFLRTFKTHQNSADSSEFSMVATATSLTIRSISDAYRRFILKKGLPLQQILLCGGGAKNQAIIQGLRKELTGVSIRSISEVGFDPQHIEAQGFAYLGYLSLLGQPVGGSWTGAERFAPPGAIIPGENWARLLTLLQSL